VNSQWRAANTVLLVPYFQRFDKLDYSLTLFALKA
jgi:hypothetical protein